MNPDPQLVSYAVGFIGFIAAVFERLRNHKRERQTIEETALLADAKSFQARSDVLSKLANDNLELYEREHAEHIKTRDYWHNKANDFQSTLTACQEKLHEMQERPDFREIMQFIKQQSETSIEILGGIREILNAIRRDVHENNRHEN